MLRNPMILKDRPHQATTTAVYTHLLLLTLTEQIIGAFSGSFPAVNQVDELIAQLEVGIDTAETICTSQLEATVNSHCRAVLDHLNAVRLLLRSTNGVNQSTVGYLVGDMKKKAQEAQNALAACRPFYISELLDEAKDYLGKNR